MVVTQGFEHFAEAVEIDRLAEQVYQRNSALDVVINRGVVDLGQSAVSEGVITRENVVSFTVATITRHLTLMDAIGLEHIVRPELTSRDEYNIGSKKVELAPDIAVSLRQKTQGALMGRGFWDHFEADGIETALGDYAQPRTTVITAYDLQREGTPFMTKYLSPGSFRDPDPEFREEWGSSFYPFPRQLDSGVERFSREGSYTATPPPTEMSDKQVIIAAGLNVIFNGLLDEVEQNLGTV